MTRIWTVLAADSNTQRVAIKGAGCTHAVINAHWSEAQPTATGSLDSTFTTTLLANFDHALSIGLSPILSVNLHYPPTWVQSGVEKFKDQSGNQYTNTDPSGKNVRNWMWTQTGRTYVTDLVTRIATALGTSRVANTAGCRLGGGWFGEVHYPEAVSGGPTNAWQAFGASMQSGTDLATGMDANPIPGYTPYTGTDAQDVTFLNWYLNGIVKWVRWEIELFKAQGFTRNLWVLMPGWGIRNNDDRTTTNYKASAALGEDHIRLLGELMHDPAVWPYSTWLDNADAFAMGDTADSSKSAWKSIYEKALARGKAANMVGENTTGESNADMDTIFAGALGDSTYPGTPGIPAQGFYYRGCAWLDYTSLNAGGANATLAHYGTNIAATP